MIPRPTGSRKKRPYVLITGGGTFARIDKMRVMANLSEGDTAIAVARRFAARGWRVVVLISRMGYYKFRDRVLDENITLVPYLFYDEYVAGLKGIVAKYGQPAYAISAAAVSDFGYETPVAGKLPSSPDGLNLNIPVLPKVLSIWRDLMGPACVTVGFKLLSQDTSAPKDLFTAAWRQNTNARLGFTVANYLEEYVGGQHPVWVVDPQGRICRIVGQLHEMAERLVAGLLGESNAFAFEPPTVWTDPRRSATAQIRCHRTNRVLHCRRASRSFNDQWCHPGGREEPGDADLLATAIRESFEEVRARLEAYRAKFKPAVVSFTETEVGGDDRFYEVHGFPLTVSEEFEPVVDPREIAEARWLTTREAAALPMGPATRALNARTWRGFSAAVRKSAKSAA